MSDDFKKQLDEVRSLLGPKAIHMSLAQLIEHMAQLSTQALKEKKFGKKRVRERQKTALKSGKNSSNDEKITPAPALLLA